MFLPLVWQNIFRLSIRIFRSVLCSYLGVSLGEDEVDLNRELTGHGVSNLVAGLLGCGIFSRFHITALIAMFFFHFHCPAHQATILHTSIRYCELLP